MRALLCSAMSAKILAGFAAADVEGPWPGDVRELKGDLAALLVECGFRGGVPICAVGVDGEV